MRILNYNIEYGGFEKHINKDKYVKLIKKHNIDIFIGTEPNQPVIDTYKDSKICADYNKYGENTIEQVAKILGFNFITTEDKAITIISRYPIKSTEVPYVFEISINDQIVIIIPIHLVDYPFTFFSLRHIPYQNTPLTFSNKQEIIDLSYSTKSKVIDAVLEYIKNNPSKKIIIAGDFNEPSHLDDPSNEWIISKKFQEQGIIDSYRYINKQVITDSLGYNIEGATCCNTLFDDEPLNRVDYIYTKNLDIVSSSVLKEYAHFSDHLPVLTEVKLVDLKYENKYLKYKIKYTLLKNNLNKN